LELTVTTEIRVPISPGELIDKITILEIKSERMSDAKKVANVKHELSLLLATWQESPYSRVDISSEWQSLKGINGKLWVIEDDIRDKERAQQFDARFIELARAVYFINDDRAAVKRTINDKLGSKIVEEKSYADYKTTQAK
jgi:chorismate mutase